MKAFLLLSACALLAGCQSPRAVYANGLIFWFSTSAVGVGYGQYAEVPSGGKLTHSSTNATPALIGEGLATGGENYTIDCTKTPAGGCGKETCRCSPCNCTKENCCCQTGPDCTTRQGASSIL